MKAPLLTPNTMKGELTFVIFLFCVVAVMAVPTQGSDDGSCDVSGGNRYECGWLGITAAQCQSRGCCYDDSDPNAKYCFVKKGEHLPDGLCPVAPSERQECGYYGITKEECLGNSCCWDESVEGAKWCFQQPEEEPMSCYIYHGVYGTCKYVCDPSDSKMYGIGECKGRICCYQSTSG